MSRICEYEWSCKVRILFYHWPSYFEKDIQDIFVEKSISFDVLEWRFDDKNHDDSFLAHVRENVNVKSYDVIFSVNYWPLISVIAQESHVPYVSWCYDNPLNVRDIELTLGNEVNHVYCFDIAQTEGYRRQGYNVNYLTLGVNADRLRRLKVSEKERNRFSADVSFVGKLYESATDWIMAQTDDYCKGYIQSVINAQQEIYGAYIIDKVISEDFLNRINTSFKHVNPDNDFKLQKEELVFALSCEVTRRDRIILLSLMGTRFRTKFYSYNDSSVIKGVERCSTVDYRSEMPYVFASSKINLNPCLRAIQTGIPLRALDIMACGGFLLSNYQQELAELFEHEGEMVMYESYQDAVEKAEFYLKHDDIRMSIAQNGKEKVLRDFDMKDRLKYVLNNI